MRPTKICLKAIKQADATNIRSINIPRLQKGFSWGPFLAELLSTPQNRKAFTRCEHADVVELLRKKANEQFKNDSELLKRALAGVRVTLV